MDEALRPEPAPEAAPANPGEPPTGPRAAPANSGEPPPVLLARPKKRLPQPPKNRASSAASTADLMNAPSRAPPKVSAKASASGGCMASAAAGGHVLEDCSSLWYM